MPFCHFTLTAAKPRTRAYPTSITTLGDHIRAHRLDLSLLQKDVARKLGCTVGTITNWELSRVQPAFRYLPRIVDFLGYDPRPYEESASLEGRLKAHRLHLGLSRKRLARILKTDPSNLAGWETGKHSPTKKSIDLIAEFLTWTSPIPK